MTTLFQKYGEEVEGYMGLDTSVPYQIHEGNIPVWIYSVLKISGIYRAVMNLAPEGFMLPWLNEKENQWLIQITWKNLGNKNMINEEKLFKENIEKVQKLQYPKELPVILFLSSESVEADDFWLREHEYMIADSICGKLEILDGPHYIHHGNERKIRQKLNSFFEFVNDEQRKNK